MLSATAFAVCDATQSGWRSHVPIPETVRTGPQLVGGSPVTDPILVTGPIPEHSYTRLLGTGLKCLRRIAEDHLMCSIRMLEEIEDSFVLHHTRQKMEIRFADIAYIDPICCTSV